MTLAYFCCICLQGLRSIQGHSVKFIVGLVFIYNLRQSSMTMDETDFVINNSLKNNYTVIHNIHNRLNYVRDRLHTVNCMNSNKSSNKRVVNNWKMSAFVTESDYLWVPESRLQISWDHSEIRWPIKPCMKTNDYSTYDWVSQLNLRNDMKAIFWCKITAHLWNVSVKLWHLGITFYQR